MLFELFDYSVQFILNSIEVVVCLFCVLDNVLLKCNKQYTNNSNLQNNYSLLDYRYLTLFDSLSCIIDDNDSNVLDVGFCVLSYCFNCNDVFINTVFSVLYKLLELLTDIFDIIEFLIILENIFFFLSMLLAYCLFFNETVFTIKFKNFFFFFFLYNFFFSIFFILSLIYIFISVGFFNLSLIHLVEEILIFNGLNIGIVVILIKLSGNIVLLYKGDLYKYLDTDIFVQYTMFNLNLFLEVLSFICLDTSQLNEYLCIVFRVYLILTYTVQIGGFVTTNTIGGFVALSTVLNLNILLLAIIDCIYTIWQM